MSSGPTTTSRPSLAPLGSWIERCSLSRGSALRMSAGAQDRERVRDRRDVGVRADRTVLVLVERRPRGRRGRERAGRTERVLVLLSRPAAVVPSHSSVDHVAERLVQADREVVRLSHEEVDAASGGSARASAVADRTRTNVDSRAHRRVRPLSERETPKGTHNQPSSCSLTFSSKSIIMLASPSRRC